MNTPDRDSHNRNAPRNIRRQSLEIPARAPDISLDEKPETDAVNKHTEPHPNTDQNCTHEPNLQ